MKKSAISLIVIIFVFSIASCKKGEPSDRSIGDIENKLTFESMAIDAFFESHPKLKEFRPQVEKLYQKHNYHYVWFDRKGVNEVGDLLYSKINNLDEEGVPTTVPYKPQLDEAIENDNAKPNVDTELLISSLYFFYANKVYHGVDAKQSEELGWYLPRKKMSYVNYLDSLLIKPSLMNKDEKEVLGQYYRLREVLQKYRDIEKKGGWKTITVDTKAKLKPGDSSATIAQLRERLAITGDIKSDSKSAVFDDDLAEAIVKYKGRTGSTPDNTITPKFIEELNIPVSQRIKTIMVNMERCRWTSNGISKLKEFIVINIPAYRMSYYKEGQPPFISDVVVGKDVHKTVVFSGMMKYVVFSPYWNIPKSIVKKEIEPGIAQNSNYLEEHDMERDGSNYRQKPGPKNSLGLVKFLFPNSNNIYLHDSPAKALFNEESRAFSHGCIRVAKAKELAYLILKDEKEWTPRKIDAAMHLNDEKWVTLKNKIPVFIGYFTAWADNDGVVHFYRDIYNRDERLAEMVLGN
jgi:murein L,D-transpeptidase YcbB/YkuD